MSPQATQESPFGTDLVSAEAHVAATARAAVEFINSTRQAQYDAAVRFYNENVGSGALGQNPVPPVAPFMVVYDPPQGPQGFGGWVESPMRMVPTPPLVVSTAGVNQQPNPVPDVILIGGQNGSTRWYTALKGDTFPSGMTTPPQPDGHTYQKFGAPVGPGWYLQVG